MVLRYFLARTLFHRPHVPTSTHVANTVTNPRLCGYLSCTDTNGVLAPHSARASDMSTRVPSYLRRDRRAWGLSQSELARLLGFTSRSLVSKLERGERAPSVEALLAAMVLFGATAPELFPQFYSHIKERLMRDAAALFAKLDGDTSLKAKRKRELLNRALHSAISSSLP